MALADLRRVLIIVACVGLLYPAAAQAQPPTDAQIYASFRTWVSSGTVSQQADVMTEYRKVLASQGVPPAEIDRRIRVITESGRKLEIDRWNQILTSSKPAFNVKPNAFLVRVTNGLPTGTALDVGMGQGRNAIYLAQQGWKVTGFDPAEQAVAAAVAQARQLGLQLTTSTVGEEEFDFGKDRWDLILLSYVSLRAIVPKITESLKPGGRVVIEAFHRDSLKNGPIGGGVVFDTNELLKLFERFRIIQYEDTEDASDFGSGKNRVVRLVAQKQ